MTTELIREADRLINQNKPEKALKVVRKAQKELSKDEEPDLTLEAKLSGLLIDLGERLWKEELTKEGLAFLEEHNEELKRIIQPASLEYNIGNAKQTLYTILRFKEKQKFTPESISLLIEAKDHYWKALKFNVPDRMQRELCVNLANSLDSTGRLVEALYWYDQALSVDPDFGMAHFNRAQALVFLNSLSDMYSISLLEEVRDSMKIAVEDSQLPSNLSNISRKRIDEINSYFKSQGWTDEKIAKDKEQHDLDYQEYDEYWRFCLANHLALSEHSLYCNCSGARRDDLTIMKQSGPIAGDFVPKLELLLNRIKSEYCLARALYYQSNNSLIEWPIDTFEGTFTELNDDEATGLIIEFLRDSFRLCFGILDKIAQGLNELYSFADIDEPLYFEKFWHPRNEKGEERWKLINSQTNTSLVALYSLATDLNDRKGKWKFFKVYRNLMEHGLLVLLEDDHQQLSEQLESERIQTDTVSVAEFREHALQMLQFTRSAIFGFTFCVREEGLKIVNNNNQEDILSIQLDKKPIGKE